jgi:hypothetical protein
VSPSRRLLLRALALLVVVGAASLVLPRVLDLEPLTSALRQAGPQDPVLLVPGQRGSTGALELLAAALRVAVPTPSSYSCRATGAATCARGAAPRVRRRRGAGRKGRERGLCWRTARAGSPHGCTRRTARRTCGAVVIARLPATTGPSWPRCGRRPSPRLLPGTACQQLAPGSDLLDDLNGGDETPAGPQWLSVWTEQDETVTPPDSARLDGAVNVALQDLCPGLQVTHGELPTGPVVRALVLQALSTQDVARPAPALPAERQRLDGVDAGRLAEDGLAVQRQIGRARREVAEGSSSSARAR